MSPLTASSTHRATYRAIARAALIAPIALGVLAACNPHLGDLQGETDTDSGSSPECLAAMALEAQCAAHPVCSEYGAIDDHNARTEYRQHQCSAGTFTPAEVGEGTLLFEHTLTAIASCWGVSDGRCFATKSACDDSAACRAMMECTFPDRCVHGEGYFGFPQCSELHQGEGLDLWRALDCCTCPAGAARDACEATGEVFKHCFVEE